ncbi:hypothetical protein [Dactylosporangium sp. CA-233914]|uniref:hypothetical protein n=1 Tax=Dactylosporangium sp. CA-233914 TaxID=3239934 RepID=UPI003D8D2B26
MRSTRARTRNLAVLELLNAPLLGWVFFIALPTPRTLANVLGLGLVALLLVEGAAYWTLKHRQLTLRHRRPAGMGVFRVLARLNPVALTAGLAIITAEAIRNPAAESIPGLAFWAFAALEYVNYFHVQLMHDTRADLRRLFRTRRPHRSHLNADLRAAARVAPSARRLPPRAR